MKERKRNNRIVSLIMIVFFIVQFLTTTDFSLISLVSLSEQKGSISMAATLPEPVCSYSFNHTIGTASLVIRENDTIEGGNTGTIPIEKEKEALYTDGISGKGLYLDGSYGIKLYPEIEGEVYSISFWVKPETADMYSPIFYAGKELLTEQEMSLQMTRDDTTSPAIISTSVNGGYFAGKGQKVKEKEWNHICITVNGNKVQIYVNGTFQSEGMILEHMTGHDMEYYLGIDPYNTLFCGSFDNVEFYDSCLLAETVTELYKQEKNMVTDEKITKVTLNKKEVILNRYGSFYPLFADIEPKNAINQNITWISSNEEVVTVKNGIIFAWKNGNAVITAVTEEGNLKAQCNVIVKDILELKSIQLSETELLLQGDGSNAILLAKANPLGAYLPTLIWKTEDKNIAAVDQAGTVTAIANGKTVITVQSEDGNFSARCQVIVQGLSKEVAVENVEFTEHSIALTNKKRSHVLTTKITPRNAANQQCTYYSEDNDIAIVDSDGKVTAIGNGITKISVISSDGRFTDSCQVKVTGFVDTKVKALKLDCNSLKIAQGDIGYLYVETTPITATEVLQWSSNNTDVADVVADDFGTSAEVIVYADAIMGSTAMITVSSETGISAECFIEVTEYGVEKLSIEKSNICLLPGESFDVDTEIKPESAASSELLWRSSNLSVASVKDGMIKVKEDAKVGATAKITSMTLSRKKKASVVVTVKSKKVQIKKLKAKKKTFTLYPGEKAKFSVDYSPRNATENKISYVSQNNKIVKIDKNGKISVPADYKGMAEVKITAKAKNGKKVIGIVKVKQKEIKVKNLIMSRPNLELYSGKNTTLYINSKPRNATTKNITWTSSNQDIVGVTGSGKKAAIQVKNLSSKGNAIITAKDENGAMADCKISVLPKPIEDTLSGNISGNHSNNDSDSSLNHNPKDESKTENKQKKEIKSISFGTQSYIAVKRGKSVNLKKQLSISPGDAKYKLQWQSKNNYVFVTKSGIISVSSKSPKKLRSTILVTTDNGKKASIDILVQ